MGRTKKEQPKQDSTSTSTSALPDIKTTKKEDLFRYYNQVLNHDDTKRSQNDICTPIECIQEMLDKLPPSIWQQRGIAALDPCCGAGNFHAAIYWRLIEAGANQDEALKSLHFNDLNQDRINHVKSIYKTCEGAGGSITCQDFLDPDYTPKVEPDLIVANPPYAKLMKSGERASKNHNMIAAFVEKSLNLVKPGGFLVFITPDNWMSFADRNHLIGQLTELQIHHLDIHSAKRHFPKVGSSFTWYVIQKCPAYKDITVSGIWKSKPYCGQVRSQERRFIPLLYDSTVQSIVEKTLDLPITEPRFQVQTSSDLHRYTKAEWIRDQKSTTHPYRLIHTPKQTAWASRPHKYQSGYKVFISLTDRYQVFIDHDCGMTQSIAFITCDDRPKDAEIIKGILDHPLYVFLNNICRWGNFNNVRILQNFPIPRDPQDIYGSFGINEEEQQYIKLHL